MIVYSATIFISAFLLFQVQPVIARFILPWFGGTPAVWTSCMLFFQVALLLGYGYAHLLATQVALRRQPVIHLGLLLLSFLMLPIAPDIAQVSGTTEQPTLSIMILLFFAVGFPFLMVSSSAPLLQHWFASSYPNATPFRLYALSNAASLLALLSYPIAIEPVLRLSMQSLLWSGAYVVFGLFTAACAVIVYRSSMESWAKPETQQVLSKHTIWERTLWTLLAACGSVVLLASTNQLSQDVAVVPFLWILPLSLYLISFIICFDRDRWYQRWLWYPFLGLMLIALVYLMRQDYAGYEISLPLQIAIYSGAVFACCMVCHGELVRRRSAANQLTTFYLYVALGGALGGVFVNLIAPLIFDGYWELHGSLVATVILAGICLWQDPDFLSSTDMRRTFAVTWVSALALLIIPLGLHIQEQRDLSIFNTRGFFGVLHVYQDIVETGASARYFYHGRVNHGFQIQTGEMRLQATSYYGVNSGIAAAFRNHPGRSNSFGENAGLKVGVVGLGIGTISALAQASDTVRFYEINPQVEEIAGSHFSYLEDTPGNKEVIIGDARISMRQELTQDGSQQYDILVVDAFSGDAIPVHLLTQEAMDLYWQHLKADGVLLLHITNFHLDLSDLVRNLAQYSGKRATLISDPAQQFYELSNNWVLVTDNAELDSSPEILEMKSDWERIEPKETFWTDDFNNIFEVIDWD